MRCAPLLLVLTVGIGPACVRFKPPALDEPAVVLERFVFCASVVPKEAWAEPGPAQTSFRKGTDGQVCAFISFRDLRGPHTLGWRWYGPSGRIARSPEAIPVGEEGKSYASYIAWDAIALDADRESGVWTVAISLDGVFLTSGSFEIR
jgi:hypothetical protein